MQAIITCVSLAHDLRLLSIAAIICTVGVYASAAVAFHAARQDGQARRMWAGVSIVASGCTAWATHMVALLAFDAGMQSGFEPSLTAASLLLAIIGIGFGVALSVGRQPRLRRFSAGVVLGLGITALHYVGQTAYLVTGQVAWDKNLVVGSVLVSLSIFGMALVAAGERSRTARRFAAPMLLVAIAVLHLFGVAAVTLTYDPQMVLPANAMAPTEVAPVIAGICFGLLTLAFVGLRMTLNARKQARKDKERLRELASLAVEGLAVCDGDVIATANQSLERLSGLRQPELAGKRLSLLLPGLVVADLPEQEERDAALMTADGQSVPVRVLRKEVRLGHKRQTVVAIRDQRERLQTEAKMRALAFSDSLTGLPNRARLNDLMAHHTASWRSHGRGFALLLIDLDRFKLVNDTLGHGAGDVLLREVAMRLQAVVHEKDAIARLGGDEFAVLHVDMLDLGTAQALAQRIVDAVGRPFVLNDQQVNIGASVGVALAPMDGGQPEVLMRNADLALYKAKAEGKATFRMFEPALAERMEARRVLEADMRRALAADEFELHYQPLVDARSGDVTAAEALVRWRHPQRGLVPPDQFIPLAEETGLIIPLGSWVLRTACAHAAAWPAHIKIAVNLSPVQFRDDQLPGIVASVLSATGLPALRLELEITEGVLLDNEERTLATLTQLRALGVSIAMDDFGTGYSSLSYLRRFPFDKIKVDRSFVRQLPADAESAAIIRAIITMGACLGMTTTIEGVETVEQYDFVASEKCGQIQGYLVSRPLPLAAFLTFLSDARAAA